MILVKAKTKQLEEKNYKIDQLEGSYVFIVIENFYFSDLHL